MDDRTSPIFVTGGTGFVGSRLVRTLFTAGQDVRLLVRPGSSTAQLGDLAHRLPVFETGFNQQELQRIMQGDGGGVVIHLASRFVAAHGSDDIPDMLAANLELGTQLLEASVRTGVAAFINTSTHWEFWRESDPSPVCLYSATKRAFESILDFYASAHELHCVTLALGDTYGPGDPRGKIIGSLLAAACDGRTLSVSPGQQRLDPLFVDDVIDAYLLTLERLRADDADFLGRHRYELFSDQAVTLRELVALIESTTGRQLDIVWGGRDYRDREVMTPLHVDPRLPGWLPEHDLASGLRKTLAATGRS